MSHDSSMEISMSVRVECMSPDTRGECAWGGICCTTEVVSVCGIYTYVYMHYLPYFQGVCEVLCHHACHATLCCITRGSHQPNFVSHCCRHQSHCSLETGCHTMTRDCHVGPGEALQGACRQGAIYIPPDTCGIATPWTRQGACVGGWNQLSRMPLHFLVFVCLLHLLPQIYESQPLASISNTLLLAFLLRSRPLAVAVAVAVASTLSLPRSCCRCRALAVALSLSLSLSRARAVALGVALSLLL